MKELENQPLNCRAESAARSDTLLRGVAAGVPDVQTQLETLLDQVWRCEADWRLDDRINLAVRWVGGLGGPGCARPPGRYCADPSSASAEGRLHSGARPPGPPAAGRLSRDHGMIG